MDLDRYRRQVLVKELGKKGQETLSKKYVVIIGGGGLGSNSANILARMGLGKIDIIDNDNLDITNLHRMSIFDEEDLGKLKCKVIEEKLEKVNSKVKVRGINKRIEKKNIESLVKSTDLILDGTDNLETRFLINEIAVKKNIPWIYTGVNSTIGMVMGIIPKKTPCLNCISQGVAKKITDETPVLGNLPVIMASIQCIEGLKVLLGQQLTGLIIYDIWKQHFEILKIKRNPKCTFCTNYK